MAVIVRPWSGSGHVMTGTRSTDWREFSASGREDAAAPADLVFLRCQRQRLVVFPWVMLRRRARPGLELQLVAVPRVGHGLRALHDVEPEIERVPAEDVAHVLPQTTTISRPASSAIALSPAGSSRGRADREPIARDEKRLAGVHARAEVRHQVPECAAFHRSSSVSRLSDTQSAAGVIWSVSIASSFCRRPAASGPRRSARGRVWRWRRPGVWCLCAGQIIDDDAGLQSCGNNRVHRVSCRRAGSHRPAPNATLSRWTSAPTPRRSFSTSSAAVIVAAS